VAATYSHDRSGTNNVGLALSQVEETAWLFPAKTASGHIQASSLRKQHAKALKASGVTAFELYVLRHTYLTRWAKWMDPFTFQLNRFLNRSLSNQAF
jgi:integrase